MIALEQNESIASICLGIIERNAPRLMRTGGGGLEGAASHIYAAPIRTTPEQKARVLELARTGRYNRTEIAHMVGIRRGGVEHICTQAGIAVKDGRNPRNRTT